MINRALTVIFKTLKTGKVRRIADGVRRGKGVVGKLSKARLIGDFGLNIRDSLFFPAQIVLHIVIRHIG
jgi:hypothetical protein